MACSLIVPAYLFSVCDRPPSLNGEPIGQPHSEGLDESDGVTHPSRLFTVIVMLSSHV